MALFGFGKKKEETKTCGCENDCTSHDIGIKKPQEAEEAGASVKVLGSGCARCNELEKAVKAALEQLGMDSRVEHVKDFAKIASYGVMGTPALVVDGKVLSSGKVLSVEEVIKLLQKARTQ